MKIRYFGIGFIALVAIGMIFSLTRTARGASVSTFTPSADAYVISTSSASNYGGVAILRVADSPAMISYLRFDLNSLEGSVVQAQLRVYALNTSKNGLSVHPVIGSWSEKGITYSNQPRLGEQFTRPAAIAKGKWVEVDVTSLVKVGTEVSLGLSAAGNTGISLSSRESGEFAPQLVVRIERGESAATPTSQPSQEPTYTTTLTSQLSQTSLLAATSTPQASAAVQPTSIPTALPTASPAAPVAAFQPNFPIRAAFYYPWFPEAWTQKGISPYTNYNPILGSYSSEDPATIQQHIGAMQYGNIQAGISSWWGQGQPTDVKFPQLLIAAAQTTFRWALYYEEEGYSDPSVSQISSDLDYILGRYGSDPAYLRVNGRPVVFVYGDARDGCEMSARWKEANTQNAYIMLKVFPGYLTCASQPDSWHQYDPANETDSQGLFSYSISPGFWLKGKKERLGRDPERWLLNVKSMVASGADWQLIATFNEWGEGTSIEPAKEWASASGYGWYLDTLHDNGSGATTPDPDPASYPREGTLIPTTTPIFDTPASSGSTTILAVGDIAKCLNQLPEPTNKAYITASMLQQEDGMIFALGDLSNDSGSEADYSNCFGPMWGSLKDRIYPVMGNHDQMVEPKGLPFFNYFGAASHPETYGHYSFDLGSWHIVVLNSACSLGSQGCGAGSQQEKWLRANLAASKQKCTMALWHQPLFTSGSQNPTAAMKSFWQALYDYGADVILNGHNHNYERFAPQDPSGAADPNGIREFVIGTGGASLDESTLPLEANQDVRDASTVGYLRLTLNSESYDWQYVAQPGQTFTDQGSTACK